MLATRAWNAIGTRTVFLGVGLYGLLLAPLFFSWAFLPDEAWFQRDARAIAGAAAETGWFRALLEQPPHLGYGALFWWGYGWLLDSLPFWPGLWVGRAFVWLCLISIPASLLLVARLRWPVLLLWLSLPMAWWSGKLNAPEIPMLALCAWALALALGTGRARAVAAGVCFGLAVGLKPTALVAGPAFILFLLHARHHDRQAQLTAVAAAGVAGLAGLLLANPLLLFDPRAVLDALLSASSSPDFSAETVHGLLWEERIEWDLVPSGGVFTHGVTLLATLLVGGATLLAASRFRLHQLLPVIFLVNAGAVLLLFSRERFLTWYAFPAILVLVFLAATLPVTRWQRGLVLAAAAAQLVLQGPYLVQQYELRLGQAERLATLSETRQAIDETLAFWPGTDLVLDLTETDMTLAPPDQQGSLATAAKVETSTDVGIRLHLGLDALPEDIDEVALVVGERLQRHGPLYRDPEQAEWLGHWQVSDARPVNGATLYRLARQRLVSGSAP